MSDTAAPELRAFLTRFLTDATEVFLKDLAATPEDKLGVSPGGVARAPYDFIMECAGFTRSVAASARGEEPKWPSEETKAAMRARMTPAEAARIIRCSSDELLEAWQDLPEAELGRMVPAFGEETQLCEMVGHVASHLMYHDAQLCYVQALSGDGKMHW
jgi:hypothetical protein